MKGRIFVSSLQKEAAAELKGIRSFAEGNRFPGQTNVDVSKQTGHCDLSNLVGKGVKKQPTVSFGIIQSMSKSDNQKSKTE